ncbi:TPA: multidrug efflux MFS transporter NorB [Staphylococcus aureus]|nr:multidrug efflux MFS transporter NorB [Staphylococcus aureus]HDK4731633.1 multidrug efflux MFS transporter NorB [Staphylococcus aureus]HDK4745306.1 multidrug efflux MFS transporter NorB [Staphylococcus aureus]HDK4794259.1 multidrug efflux MFS transporter NorB [Staphylococcus aureus]HDK4827396.1 multidrug efflux MFS transporter NorB [Staphylococcus aureus]
MEKPSREEFEGNNKLLIGIVLSVITFWLFAQSLVNVVPILEDSFNTDIGTVNIAVSITALFSGMFVVGAGGLADKYGRIKLTNIGIILNILGSLLIIISNIPLLLIIGRLIQGLSTACIMPATLSIIKSYYIGKDRQRALSYWSIGSWGGSGVCSFFGGAVATLLGWRWIFILSIVISLIALVLIKGTPETKSKSISLNKFDIKGLVLLVIMLLSLNILITKGSELGVTSLLFITLIAIAIGSFSLFIVLEKRATNPLIDFKLFKNKAYTGATASNFLLNGVAGTLIVANTLVQRGLGYSSLQAGSLSITYLVMVLIMIRVGEKLLQTLGCKKPMLIGTGVLIVGECLISLTFLPEILYVICCIIGYLFFGLGLGIYATPSTDTAIANAPLEKVGVAAGIYKMASALGGAFGVALSGAVYAIVSNMTNIYTGAMIALWLNAGMGILSFVIILLLVPKQNDTQL